MRARLALELGFAAPNELEIESARVVRLGRNRNNDIVLHDQHASRFHAELYFDNDGWMFRDLNTLNGSRINGGRITEPLQLNHGDVIGVGEVRLRFHCEEKPVDPNSPTPLKEPLPQSVHQPSEATTFEADDLTALVHFINSAVHQTTVNGLVKQALETIYQQLHPKVVGYQSMDRREPVWRLALPHDYPVDARLVDAISDPVRSQRQPLWVCSLAKVKNFIDLKGYEGDFKDALCLPLLGPENPPSVLGLLFVFQDRLLSERQVHFCNVLTDCMANSLRNLRIRRSLEADLLRLRGVRMGARTEEIVGNGARLRTMRDHIRKLADSSSALLINGPTGAGKELVALALHKSSKRATGPFIEVNCASVPREVAESQFFGHVRGSFSGAVSDYAGYFQQADEGILFLDEVGDLHLDVQAKLLRGFEGHGHRIRFFPVGAQHPVQVSVRIVAATHRDLRQLVDEKRFREDLYFRLAMTTIVVPALTDHLEDIPDLVQHFLDKINPEYHRHQEPVTISDEAIEQLLLYNWPGNVRQLRAVLEQAVAMCEPGQQIQAHELNIPSPGKPVVGTSSPLLPTLNVSELEEMAIREAVRQTNTQTQAAGLLGIHRDTLRAKWEKIQQKDQR